MASHNKECLHVASVTYQEIVRRAASDPLWAQYFLLTNACIENLKHLPATPEQCNQADPESLLIDALTRLATAIMTILPGGVKEFGSYLDEKPPNTVSSQQGP